MRRILLILLAAILAVCAAWAVASLPGRVSAEFGPVAIDAPSAVAAAGLLAAFLALHLALRGLGGLFGIPARLRRRRADRARAIGDRSVARALVALAANAPAEARREAARARRLLGDTAQTLLLAAEAGRLGGRDDEAEAAFRALSERPDAAFLGYRGLLSRAVAAGDWSEAGRLAGRAEAAYPGAAWLRAERAALAVKAERWAEALSFAATPQARAALATAAARDAADPATARRLAREALAAAPGLAPAAVLAARQARAAGQESRAAAILAEAWKAAPHPDLAAELASGIAAPLDRVRAARKLVAGDLAHPESRLALARACLDAGLTGEARRQLDDARAEGEQGRRAWLLRAELEAVDRGGTEEGRSARLDALRHAADAPDAAWRCGECGASAAGWAPVCPACAAIGAARWTRPADGGRARSLGDADGSGPGRTTRPVSRWRVGALPHQPPRDADDPVRLGPQAVALQIVHMRPMDLGRVRRRRGFPALPARREIEDRVMEPHPSLVVVAHRVHVVAEMQVADGEAGLLHQLAPRGLVAGLAHFLGAAGQRPGSDIRRLAAAAQQHMVAFDHHDADADERAGRIFAVGHGFASPPAAPAGGGSACGAGSDFFSPSSVGANAFSFHAPSW